MRVERIARDDAIYLRLGGVVTDQTSPELDSSLLGEDEFGRPILISLRDVILLNSSGIGMLLNLNRIIKQRGGKIVLSDVPANVRQVLEFMKLGNVLPIADSEQKAQEMLK